MKQYILPGLLLAVGIGLIVFGILTNKGGERHAHKKKIIMQGTDERGLISVVYKDGKDTFALDYLTRVEYDSIFTTSK